MSRERWCTWHPQYHNTRKLHFELRAILIAADFIASGLWG
jgi:hypothetical protein